MVISWNEHSVGLYLIATENQRGTAKEWPLIILDIVAPKRMSFRRPFQRDKQRYDYGPPGP